MKYIFKLRYCQICDKELSYSDYPEYECPNGCCAYQLDPQAGNIDMTLFPKAEGEYFNLPLYKDTCVDSFGNDLSEEMEAYMEKIVYWKRNDRYLAKILIGGR